MNIETPFAVSFWYHSKSLQFYDECKLSCVSIIASWINKI